MRVVHVVSNSEWVWVTCSCEIKEKFWGFFFGRLAGNHAMLKWKLQTQSRSRWRGFQSVFPPRVFVVSQVDVGGPGGERNEGFEQKNRLKMDTINTIKFHANWEQSRVGFNVTSTTNWWRNHFKKKHYLMNWYYLMLLYLIIKCNELLFFFLPLFLIYAIKCHPVHISAAWFGKIVL